MGPNAYHAMFSPPIAGSSACAPVFIKKYGKPNCIAYNSPACSVYLRLATGEASYSLIPPSQYH